MNKTRDKVGTRGLLVGLVLLLVLRPESGAAQKFKYGADLALVGLSSFPAAFESCRDERAVGPSLRGYYRPHHLISAELTASAHFGIGGGEVLDCGWRPPLPPGTSVQRREYEATRRDVAPVVAARIALTPTGNQPSSFRFIGGVLSYPGQATWGWLAGIGLMGATSWGGWVLDAERWSIGTSYRDILLTGAAEFGEFEVEHLDRGRTQERLWNLRLGFLLVVH